MGLKGSQTNLPQSGPTKGGTKRRPGAKGEEKRELYTLGGALGVRAEFCRDAGCGGAVQTPSDTMPEEADTVLPSAALGCMRPCFCLQSGGQRSHR